MSDEVLEDGTNDTSTETSEDVNLLSEGEETTPEEKEEETTDEEAEESEEEDSEEQEEESVDEEEDTDEEKITRPSWQELKKQFPGIEKNKEFREIYFREKAYSEVFPTVEDAKDADEKARALEYFDDAISQGNPDILYKALDPQILAKFSQNLLPSLRAHDQKLFMKAVFPITSEMLHEIHNSATTKGDKNLATSVLNVCNYLFGKFELPPRVNSNPNPEVERERKSLIDERNKLSQEKRQEFTTKVDRSIGKQLDKILREKLEVDNEFTANSVIEKAIARVKETVNSDPEFVKRLQSLYTQAERGNYSPEYVTRIVSAYLGRVKGVALKARAEFRSAAMGKRSTQPGGKIMKRTETTGKANGESKTKGKDLRSTREVSDLDIING